MSTNNIVTNKPAVTPSASLLTSDALVKLGIVSKVTAKSVTAAKAAIRADGGYFPENGSDALALAAQSILDNAKAVASATRNASLALALIEESEEYKRVLNPYGRPFKSASELYKALFPSLAESTIRNYLSVGRTIYLPGARGELPDNLKILNTLEPGTAIGVVGAMKDDNVRKALPAAISDAIKVTGKLTQSALRNAVKTAKEKAGVVTKQDGTAPTDKSDAKAVADTAISEYRAAIVKLLRPDKTADETILALDGESRKNWANLIDNALKSPDRAYLFLKALKAMDW